MRKWYPALVLLAAVVASAAVYGRLPERVPLHWNAAGEIDRHGSPLEAALVVPAIMLVMAALIPVLPKIDPRGTNYEKFRPTYHFVMNALLTFLLAAGLVSMLAAGLPDPRHIGTVMGASIAVAAFASVVHSYLAWRCECRS